MTLTCAHCGIRTPRLTIAQTRCPDCQGRVDRQMAADARRRAPRFAARDFTGRLYA
jgi:uncharacterized protein with PIN domain